MTIPWYAILMVVGFVGGAAVWGRRFRARPEMAVVYAAGLLGALLGAKAGYVLAEAWVEWGRDDFWLKMLYGKTILGALLGGYLGVEGAKRLIGYRQATGDLFAVVVPAGLALGRLGCWLHGCCLGVACEARWWTVRDAAGLERWPTAAVELGFNVVAAGVLLVLARRGVWRGQLFHVYLMAYAVFRIAHEPMRATPRIGEGWVSPYQLLAGVLLVFAAWRWRVRERGDKSAPAGL